MMYFLLGIASVAFLAHDWFIENLRGALNRVKIAYSILLLLSAYHLLIFKNWLRSFSFYDTASLIFGPAAKAIIAYLNPKG
ncbi:hypothetical protein [Cohnella silvisoli]|uniref:Uncharacterized protein n=1 Tax=Cohnella silvisoli TaxID=2873699 RepID=A0ABV1KMB5_9BACL|nr:hypothetical protein [Cohnella silvisoli]MCD9020465.1 hypothetical protein [Cohnella silvisoli]